MHAHYGFHEAVDGLTQDKLRTYLKFRANFIGEEYRELQDNLTDPEEVVDALIDICVVAIGTLDVMGVDANAAWDEVLKANMIKQVGVKPNRPNPLGLPDLMKPEGWVAPSHEGNHGKLTSLVCTEECDGVAVKKKVEKMSGSYEEWGVVCKNCGKSLDTGREDVLAGSFF